MRRSLGSSPGSANLPVILPRPTEDLDRDLVYSTLLELRYEVHSIKTMLQQFLQRPSVDVEAQLGEAEEIDAYSLDEVEKEQIKRVLIEFKGNRRLAARALGIGERTLYRKLNQYGIN